MDESEALLESIQDQEAAWDSVQGAFDKLWNPELTFTACIEEIHKFPSDHQQGAFRHMCLRFLIGQTPSKSAEACSCVGPECACDKVMLLALKCNLAGSDVELGSVTDCALPTEAQAALICGVLRRQITSRPIVFTCLQSLVALTSEADSAPPFTRHGVQDFVIQALKQNSSDKPLVVLCLAALSNLADHPTTAPLLINDGVCQAIVTAISQSDQDDVLNAAFQGLALLAGHDRVDVKLRLTTQGAHLSCIDMLKRDYKGPLAPAWLSAASCLASLSAATQTHWALKSAGLHPVLVEHVHADGHSPEELECMLRCLACIIGGNFPTPLKDTPMKWFSSLLDLLLRFPDSAGIQVATCSVFAGYMECEHAPHKEAVRALLTQRRSEFNGLFATACARGSSEVVGGYISVLGLSPDRKQEFADADTSTTPLLHCTTLGHVEVVRVLLRAGAKTPSNADINALASRAAAEKVPELRSRQQLCLASITHVRMNGLPVDCEAVFDGIRPVRHDFWEPKPDLYTRLMPFTEWLCGQPFRTTEPQEGLTMLINLMDLQSLFIFVVYGVLVYGAGLCCHEDII